MRNQILFQASYQISYRPIKILPLSVSVDTTAHRCYYQFCFWMKSISALSFACIGNKFFSSGRKVCKSYYNSCFFNVSLALVFPILRGRIIASSTQISTCVIFLNIKTLSILNCIQDYKISIHIFNRILDLAWSMWMKLHLEQHFMWTQIDLIYCGTIIHVVYHALPILRLLMLWRIKEPMHQQAWNWPQSRNIPSPTSEDLNSPLRRVKNVTQKQFPFFDKWSIKCYTDINNISFWYLKTHIV